jgi:proliferating cell nuclear antigen PCNA
MKFVIEKKEKVKQFAVIFNNLKNLSENINIHFTVEGLYAQGMTSCHCSFFELNLSDDWFKTYVCLEECVVGVNCEILFKCISSLEEGQLITFEHIRGSDKILLDFESDKTVSKHFELPLITIDTENLEVPEVEYYVSGLELNSEQLNKWVNQISIFGEEISFKFDYNHMLLSAKSVDNGKMEVKMNTTTCWDENLRLSFGVEYLRNACQFSKLNNSLELSMGEDYPLKIRYDLSTWCDKIEYEEEGCEAELITDNSIIFYVAPKIED